MADTQTSIIGARPANYAGDVSADEVWRVLQQDKNALLIDVRTKAEWTFVGLPDVSSVDKETVCVEWQTFPSMDLNAGFLAGVKQAVEARGVSNDTNLFVICRSGARSQSASVALTAAGFGKAHNVAGGFEGDLNNDRHRGHATGWKAMGLPWRQS